MVLMVSMVSMSDCGSESIGSNPFKHPILNWRVTLDGDSGLLLISAFG